MCDLDLSQALEGSPELAETGFESRCFNMTDVQEEIFRLDEGLDLVVSRNPKTMRCVATLLLVVNRMKKSLTHCGSELNDDELCSAIMDSLVDETIVKTENFSTGNERPIFHRVESVNLCTLCDDEHKDVIHELGELQLQAITLKGGNSERKVNFKLSKYITACSSADKCQAVVLSITNSNLHISCSMKDNKPVLNLEECSEEDLKSISNDTNMGGFLFYRRTVYSLTTFESAKCPGWFISTSSDENQPVEMCEANATRHRNFKMN